MKAKAKKINRYRALVLRTLLEPKQVENIEPTDIHVNQNNDNVVPFTVILGKQLAEGIEQKQAVGNESLPYVVPTNPMNNEHAASLETIGNVKSSNKRDTGDLFIGTIKGLGRSIKWSVDTLFRFINIIINTVLSLLDSFVWIAVSLVVIIGGNAILHQLGYVEFDMVNWLKETVFEWVKQTWSAWKTK